MDHDPLLGQPPAGDPQGGGDRGKRGKGDRAAVPCRSPLKEQIWSPSVEQAGLQGHVGRPGCVGGRIVGSSWGNFAGRPDRCRY